MTDATTTELPIDIPEVTDKWTMDDIRAHVETYHTGKHMGYRVNHLMLGRDQTFGKCRKESLVALHERLHTDDSLQYRDDARRRAQYNLIEHDHFELPEGAVAFGPNGEKLKTSDAPLLAQAERKTLQQLVDSDFAGLRAQITQMADDALAEMLKSVEEEFKGTETQARRFADRKTKLTRRHAEEKAKLANRHADEAATLLEEARGAGLEPVGSTDFSSQRIATLGSPRSRTRTSATRIGRSTLSSASASGRNEQSC